MGLGTDRQRTRTRTLARHLGVLLVAGALAACGGDDGADTTDGDDVAASGAEITIEDFEFGAPITVPVGSTVTVRNADGANHTLTADDGSFDAGTVEPDGTATITLDETGTFPFHCEIHRTMTGSITVEG